jgi:thioredoxin-related protein
MLFMMRMFRIVLVIVAYAVTASAQRATVPSETPLWTPLEKFDAARDPAKDITRAVAEAIRSGRRVLLDVGGEWCIWCHRLDTLFMRNPDLSDFLHRNFVVVKINYSKENKNEKLLSKYPKIPGYPHLFVLDAKGKLLHSQDTSELEEGKGHSKEKVFAFLKKWALRAKMR